MEFKVFLFSSPRKVCKNWQFSRFYFVYHSQEFGSIWNDFENYKEIQELRLECLVFFMALMASKVFKNLIQGEEQHDACNIWQRSATRIMQKKKLFWDDKSSHFQLQDLLDLRLLISLFVYRSLIYMFSKQSKSSLFPISGLWVKRVKHYVLYR